MERRDAEPGRERYRVDGRPAHHRPVRPPYQPDEEPGYEYGEPPRPERHSSRGPDPRGAPGQRGSQDPPERPGPPRAGGGAQPGQGRAGQPGQERAGQPGQAGRTRSPAGNGVPLRDVWPDPDWSDSGWADPAAAPPQRIRPRPLRPQPGPGSGTIPAATKAPTPADGRAIPQAWGRADIRAGRRHRSECRGQRLPVRQGRPMTPAAAPRVPPPGRARRDLTPWRARAASQARTRPGRPRRPPTRPTRIHPGRTHRCPAHAAPLRPPVPAPRARTGRGALTGGREGTGGARPADRKTATGGDSRAATSQRRKRATGPGPAGNTGSTPAGPTDLDRRTDTGPALVRPTVQARGRLRVRTW